MIAQDLWHDIIGYVSLADLRDLSRASVIFDMIICQIGRRIYYDDNTKDGLAVPLTDGHKIIALDSGKKYLLFAENSSSYNVLGTTGKMKCKKIEYCSNVTGDFCRFYDPATDIGIFLNVDCTYIKKNCGPIDSLNNCKIGYGLLRDSCRIDINSRIVTNHILTCKEINRFEHTLRFEHFKILWSGDSWTHAKN